MMPKLANSITPGPNPIPIILTCVFTPIAIATVALRFYCRRMKGAMLMMDDWIILPALVFAVAQAVILFVNTFAGDLGKHQPLDRMGKAIPSPRLETFQQLEYASFLTFVPALLFAKLSILHLYNRIFQVQPMFRTVIWSTYGLNVAWGIAFFIGYIFKCWPISDYWSTLNGTGSCLPYTYNIAFAFSNVILDVIILVMPLPVVWSLNMAWRQKLAVSGIFLLGTVVVILSIAKAVAFFLVLNLVQTNNDIMWDEAPLFYFSVPEALVAVTSACLPTLRPLFRKLSAPITSQMSKTGRHAGAKAASALNRVDLSARGIPVRDSKSSRASPGGDGLGRERGLGVRRHSMAGGVMWDRYIRHSDELEQTHGYAEWKRDPDCAIDDPHKWMSDSGLSSEDLESGLAELRRKTSQSSLKRQASFEHSPVRPDMYRATSFEQSPAPINRIPSALKREGSSERPASALRRQVSFEQSPVSHDRAAVQPVDFTHDYHSYVAPPPPVGRDMQQAPHSRFGLPEEIIIPTLTPRARR